MNPETYDALRALQGSAVEMISRSHTDMAPVLEVDAPMGMPALYWANRLYGDAGRVEELANRNGIPHPSFMTYKFEALAR